MKKNRFFCLLCAFVPGAGEMYMGLMKRGASLMLLFCLDSMFSILIFPMAVFLPVLWFYSFFDTLNIRSLGYEEIQQLVAKDDYFLVEYWGENGGQPLKKLLSKSQLLIGWVLLASGVYMIYDRLHNYFWNYFYETNSLRWVGQLLDSLPNAVVAFLLIAVGIRFIVGKKEKASAGDDFTPYLGETGGQNGPDNQKGM